MSEDASVLKIMILFYVILIILCTFFGNFDSINTNLISLPEINFNNNILELFGIPSTLFSILNFIFTLLTFNVNNWAITILLWGIRFIMIIELVIWFKRVIHPTST